MVNRVLVPMINEAINCVYENLASPEDVDAMMKLWGQPLDGPAFVGRPHRPRHRARNHGDPLLGFNDPKYRPSPLLKQLCAAGYLGRKSGRGFFEYASDA